MSITNKKLNYPSNKYHQSWIWMSLMTISGLFIYMQILMRISLSTILVGVEDTSSNSRHSNGYLTFHKTKFLCLTKLYIGKVVSTHSRSQLRMIEPWSSLPSLMSINQLTIGKLRMPYLVHKPHGLPCFLCLHS
jgi:hypothetical protein